MPPDLQPTVHRTRRRRWRNFHQTVEQTVAQLVDVWNAEPDRPTFESYRATTGALQALIGEAVQNGARIRALGGGWSFSSAAATDGYLVNTRPLNYQFTLAAANLHPSCPHRAEDLVVAQCGVSVAELNGELRRRGKSLSTSGASNGQTIAGALSTGTHGSAIDQGGLHDLVVGLHLVTGPDRHVYLERASGPVLSDASAAVFGAEVVRDDGLFDAALVSFGSFGIVHGVVLEVTDLFFVQEYRRQHPASEATWAAIERLDTSGLEGTGRPPGVRPYFFQAVFNPYDPDPYLTLMYREGTRPSGCEGPSRAIGWRPGDSAADVVGRLTDVAPSLTPTFVNALFPQQYPDVDGVCGTWAEMFGDTSLGGRAASTAMGVPIARVRDTLDTLLELNGEFEIPGLFAVRYVRGSRAPLAFTTHGPHTCVVEVDGAHSRRMLRYYEAAWARLMDRGVPVTFHWGKMLPLDRGWVRRSFGDAAVDAWIAAREVLLPDPAVRKAFDNGMLESLGLTDPVAPSPGPPV